MMSSTIFYRFRSQKDTERIMFDGTGLTVFDLKREIIQENKLGDGTDFQIRLYNPDTNEEYEDDSQVISRSSSVLVRRSPAIKQFAGNGMHRNTSAIGNATRYVTGKPRVYQKRQGSSGLGSTSGSVAVSGVTEEERIANMFANQENQWEQTQHEMSSATPVFHRAQNNSQFGESEGPPPPGYMCYRCGARDHWIKNCPTNSDPNFEGKRIRRTTGIPKKFLKSVEIDPDNITAEEMAQRKIMVTEDGKFVVQVADQQSWEDYQRKQQNRLINGADAKWQKDYFKDLPKELTCPITGGLLRDPVRTSKCCNKVFSKMALEDVLLESDFVCPECQTNDILLDQLVEEDEKKKEVEQYLKDRQLDSETDGKRRLDDNVGGDESKKFKIDGNSPIKPGNVPLPPVPFGMPPFPLFPPPIPFMNIPTSKDKK